MLHRSKDSGEAVEDRDHDSDRERDLKREGTRERVCRRLLYHDIDSGAEVCRRCDLLWKFFTKSSRTLIMIASVPDTV